MTYASGLPDGIPIFIPKLPIWVYFGGPWNWKYWYILRPFINLCSSSIFYPFWYIFPRLIWQPWQACAFPRLFLLRNARRDHHFRQTLSHLTISKPYDLSMILSASHDSSMYTYIIYRILIGYQFRNWRLFKLTSFLKASNHVSNYAKWGINKVCVRFNA
jgi:hypothetical protein